jgi:hypothetical protein
MSELDVERLAAAWESYKRHGGSLQPMPVCRTETRETHQLHLAFVRGWRASKLRHEKSWCEAYLAKNYRRIVTPPGGAGMSELDVERLAHALANETDSATEDERAVGDLWSLMSARLRDEWTRKAERVAAEYDRLAERAELERSRG